MPRRRRESTTDLPVFIHYTYYYLSHRSTKFPTVLNFRVVDLNQVWRALQEMAEAMNREELRIHLEELFLKSLVEEGGEKIPVS